MLERQVVIPTSPDQLWNALTDPESMASWFGSQVEWDLRTGGAARFVDDDGTLRRGLVEAVSPGRHLSFVWWPEDAAATGASRVSYVLEPDDEGTQLTVTERPLSTVPVPAAPAGPVTSAAPSARPAAIAQGACGACGACGAWTEWDARLFRCWAQAGVVARAQFARR